MLAALVLLGCPPPYNADLNLAVQLTSRMRLIGTLGPVNVSGGSLPATEAVFLPVRQPAADIGSVTAQPGFVVSSDGFSDYVQFAYVTMDGRMENSGGNSYPLIGSDPNYPPLVTFAGVATASTATILIAGLDPAVLPASYDMGTATLPQGPASFTGSQPDMSSLALAAPWSTSTIVGMSIQAQPTQDTSFWLLFDAVSLQYGEVQSTVPTGGAFTAASSPLTSALAFLGGATPVMYFRDPALGVGYASFFSGGAWQCWSWQPGDVNTRQLTGITHRVDALLSTGQLLSLQDGVLRLYDPAGSGRQVFSVDLQGLRFCYETYVGPVPYIFFSQSMNFGYGDWGFRIYAIPTAELFTLR